jgi:hypothetical protein
MTFAYNDRHYKIQFEYAAYTGHAGRGLYCHIFEVQGNTETEIATGWSSCVPQDRFVKETGRKIALARALRHPYRSLVRGPDAVNGGEAHWVDQLPQPWDAKTFRTAAWTAYLNRREIAKESNVIANDGTFKP